MISKAWLIISSILMFDLKLQSINLPNCAISTVWKQLLPLSKPQKIFFLLLFEISVLNSMDLWANEKYPSTKKLSLLIFELSFSSKSSLRIKYVVQRQRFSKSMVLNRKKSSISSSCEHLNLLRITFTLSKPKLSITSDSLISICLIFSYPLHKNC